MACGTGRDITGRNKPVQVLSYTINAPGAPAAIMQYAEENIRPVIGRIQGVSEMMITSIYRAFNVTKAMKISKINNVRPLRRYI